MNPYLNSPNLAFLGGIGVPELIIIFLIVLLLFGANKIPKIAKDIGGGIKEFKKAMNEHDNVPHEDNKKDRPS
jgi:sec-independent protein translocase protein TatA